MSKVILLLCVLVCSICTFGQEVTQGSLYAVGKQGKELGACPLKTTSVKAEISGFVARVNVRQEFENSFSEPIEAVYTFPLSQNGAVDRMTMTIGDHVIHGKIMKREEARKVYEVVKSQGQRASLLDQERPNIFTQSVANIMPADKVIIEISYVETLKYEDGSYEFVFPMTVGPRYIPGSVKDAAKISPPVAETRNGSDISIDVSLNAGVPIEEIRSTSHQIDQTNFAPNVAKISLRGDKTIPNKDFILRYDVTGKRIEDALLTHRDERGGFFTLILQPPDKIADEDRTPKEIVFVLDTSGSMYGFPIEKAKEAMRLSIEGLYPDDTFNLITFAGDTSILFDKPVPATQLNLERAQAFLDSRQGGGGTEMMKAIKTALDPSDASDHLRIVCFMTDGYVGNEEEIISEVQKHPNARVFSFGIGSSVNRYLLDKMAEAGKGEVEYVALNDDGSKAAKKFYERVRTPLLTDLSIDWNGLPVTDVYPSRLSDLFSAKPVIVHGRYKKAASGSIKLKGKVAGQEYVREIKLELPESESAADSLASLWARTRVDDLTSEKLKYDTVKQSEFDKQITSLALEFGIMSAYTSFVAVEDRVVNQNGKPATVQVPVNLPEGVNRATTVGGAQETVDVSASTATVSVSSSSIKKSKKASGRGVGYGSGSGMGSGSGGGGGGGMGNGSSAGGPPAPAKSESKISANITSKQLSQLPVNSRSSSSLMRMSSGVVNYSIDGASGRENVFVIDSGEVGPAKNAMGRTVLIVEPNYPDDSKAKQIVGEVVVAINVDRDGNVISAVAESGPDELRSSSSTAATLSKFAPFVTNDAILRLSGTIVYNFKADNTVEIKLKNMKAAAATDEDKRAFVLANKLHFLLYRWLTGGMPADAPFFKDGMVNVVLTVRPGADAKLKSTGFESAGKSAGGSISGRISASDLPKLADLPEVQYIAPRP